MAIRGVFLHGPSSSGKSALARALQLELPEPWLVFDADTALSGYPFMHRLFVEEDNRRWAYAYLVMVKGLVAAGFGVIAEQVLWTDGHVVDCRAVLGDLPILFVGLTSRLDVAETREAARVDREAGTARHQFATVCWRHEYDLVVDTSDLSPLDAARIVAERVADGRPPTALSRLEPCRR
jgi:chloramphenicol 3-O phosphotransferase